MYTTIYTEYPIAAAILGRAFSAAVGTPLATIAVVESDEPGGAVDAWGDPDITTALQCWTVPGEFPFAVEILIKPPLSECESEDLSVLRRVSAELHVPVVVPQELDRILAIFPDGTDLIVDEDPDAPGDVIALKESSRRAFAERRVQTTPVPA